MVNDLLKWQNVKCNKKYDKISIIRKTNQKLIYKNKDCIVNYFVKEIWFEEIWWINFYIDVKQCAGDSVTATLCYKSFF